MQRCGRSTRRMYLAYSSTVGAYTAPVKCRTDCMHMNSDAATLMLPSHYRTELLLLSQNKKWMLSGTALRAGFIAAFFTIFL